MMLIYATLEAHAQSVVYPLRARIRRREPCGARRRGGDVAAAFRSAEWEYIRWALLAQWSLETLVGALFALDGPTQVEGYIGSGAGRTLRVTWGMRQGCPASGTRSHWAAVAGEASCG